MKQSRKNLREFQLKDSEDNRVCSAHCFNFFKNSCGDVLTKKLFSKQPALISAIKEEILSQ